MKKSVSKEAGNRVSGRYVVKDGMVIVTAFDGRKTFISPGDRGKDAIVSIGPTWGAEQMTNEARRID